MRKLRHGAVAVAAAVLAACLCPPAAAEPPPRLAAPPMGWNHWNRFRCDIDEQIIRDTADALVRSGLRDAGYRYVNVDDCWQAGARDSDGNLAADPVTFPAGIPALAAYVHERGLKFGIYTAVGDKTCEGRPASGGNYERDATTFARWGVDYVKLDWCGATGDPHALASEFRAALDATGRPVVLGVSRHGAPWTWPDRPADLWRTSADIDDRWHSMLRNAEEEAGLAGAAGPGRGWNDPDMLQIGNGGMSATEYRAHLSLWAVLAAPLLMGNDLRTMSPETVKILGNREVIAVDQDPLGKPGDRIRTDGGREVWARPLAGGDVAVALFNRGAHATEIRAAASEVGLPPAVGYRVRDLWTGRQGHSAGDLSADVPPHGAVLLRVSPGHHGPAWHTLSADAAYTEPGRPTPVTVRLGTSGRLPGVVTGLDLTAPEGWRVRRTDTGPPVAVPGRPATARFEVTPPEETAPGTATLRLSGRYDGRPVTADHAVVVPPAAPRGTGPLSRHPRVQEDNGWYLPMKIDRSFGPDDFCGDCPGGPLTIGGKRYATGLGTYASAQVSYYLGAACDTVRVAAGVDDEVLGMTWPGTHNVRGTAKFDLYADGRRVFGTGLMAAGTPAREATVDTRGVRELKLVSHSGGDGNFADHADWGDLTTTCAGS
ncbi:NPCBM/NEW2 domain-containing protein [Amycolatopsis suaedae]|uniref:NPCBM/NEW2 domain-containing protein n=1 Tax=Amycolatopsis suaedae TaxID=2510978 RepID=UPI0013EF3244|nr:NPCBM/NEW2 domain-containing protein [Amycolatopsis suaedae]